MKQFRFLMSSGSPLTEGQKAKDKAEAHEDPSLVHHHKGGGSMGLAETFKKNREKKQ